MKTRTLVSLAAGLLLATSALRLAADVQEDWNTRCALCHGKDGAAQTRAARLCGAKDLTKADYQKTFTDDKLFGDLKGGLTVDGKVKMKPFQDKLGDDQIKALIAYVRTLAK